MDTPYNKKMTVDEVVDYNDLDGANIKYVFYDLLKKVKELEIEVEKLKGNR